MFTKLYNFLTRSIIVLVISMLSVNYLPDKLFCDFNFEPKSMESINYENFKPNWNTQLSDNQPEYIQLNNIIGPESITFSPQGLMYTGLADGRIVELDPAKNYQLRNVLKFKPNSARCVDNVATRSDLCGRFLQLRFINSSLYAIEANTGLYKITNVKTGDKTFLGPKGVTSKTILYNSFAFDPKQPNLVYITVSSTRWSLMKIIWSLMELEDSGKLIAMDIVTGKTVTVLDRMMMPNGIDIDIQRDRLLMSESMKSKIWTIGLAQIRENFDKTANGGKISRENIKTGSLIETCPGIPDNVVVEGDEAYIALPMVKIDGKELVDHLSTMPNVRMAYARLVYGVGQILEYVCDNLYHHPLLETVYLELKSGHVGYRITQSDQAAVIIYNLGTGSSKLLGSNAFGFVSEAVPDGKGNLYLGSFRSSFLVKTRLV